MSPKLTVKILRDAIYGNSNWESIFKKRIPYFKTLSNSMFLNREDDKCSIEVLILFVSRNRKVFLCYSFLQRNLEKIIFCQQ